LELLAHSLDPSSDISESVGSNVTPLTLLEFFSGCDVEEGEDDTCKEKNECENYNIASRETLAVSSEGIIGYQ
jgi:hypothetical protein